jgi:hypothetical protein
VTKKTFHLDGRKKINHPRSYHFSPKITNHEPQEMLLPIIQVMPVEMCIAVAAPLAGITVA